MDWVHTPVVERLIESGKAPDGIPHDVWNCIVDIHHYSASATPLNVAIITRQSLQRDIPSPQKALQAVGLARVRNAGDSRDKLFGVAGIVDIGIEIDYALPVDTLYVKFAERMIAKISDLYWILRCVGGDKSASALQLPSWTPDWTVRSEVLPGNSTFSANGTAPAEARRVHVDGRALRASGIFLDVIAEVLQPPRPTSASHDEYSMQNIASAAQFLLQCDAQTILEDVLPEPASSRPYLTGIPMLQAVSRLMSADVDIPTGRLWSSVDSAATRPYPLPPLIKALVLDASVKKELRGLWRGADERPSTHKPVANDLDFELLANVLEPHRTVTLSTEDIVRSANTIYSDELWSRYVWSSPFTSGSAVPFRTVSGYIGYASAGVRKDDIVCLLGSCSLPVVFRRAQAGLDSEQELSFVSLAHVLGVMYGEGWRAAAAGRDKRVSIREFTLV